MNEIDTKKLLEEIDQLTERIRSRARTIEAMVSARCVKSALDWHLVEEGQPKETGAYLMTVADPVTGVWYVKEGVYVADMGWYINARLIAWAPMPEPYRGCHACDEIAERTAAMETTPPDTKWIPCSETIEIPDHEVIACDKNGVEMMGYLIEKDEQWICESDGCTMYNPIAWTEKPEPYKGK